MTVTATSILRGSCNGSSVSPILLDYPEGSNDHKHRRPSPTPEDPILEDQVDQVLSQLTPDELETAARSDYDYLQNPGEEPPHVAARPMALRYLKSKKDPQLALEKMKKTIAFRQKIDIDGLRLALEEPFSDYSEPLEKFLASGKNFVQSYDKEGRATHVFVPRKTQQQHEEWTLKESLYTMERAMACSKAPDKTVNAILDFRGFHPTQHAPPLSLGKNFLLTLRHHYAGQVHRIFILDAPASFTWIWKVFRPFLGTSTRDKIVFVNGTRQKEQVLGEYYAPDQATKWMLPRTGQMVERELDLHEYLWKTPFDRAFNE
jgi:CRAL/TRIO domain